MKKLQLLLATIAVSIGVALTYHYFELVVRHSIDYVWNDLFDTQAKRWLVVPLCVVISLIFFGVQHWLDQASEKKQAEGLGAIPKPTIANFAKVLSIGFLSLLAGASLGPEAILVPACMLIGGYVGGKLFKDKQMVRLLGMVGFIALMAAFFNSFFTGILGLLLVTKQVKLKLTPPVVVLAVVASLATVVALGFLPAKPYVQMPPYSWQISAMTLVTLSFLLVAGFAVTYGLKFAMQLFEKVEGLVTTRPWWLKAVVASLGLSALYLVGGSLVMFTGNDSIVPMLEKAPSLGLAGLAGILVVKIAAISWSKSMGYRGGLIFPTVFVAAVCVAIAQTITADVSFVYGLIAVMIGVFVAESKVKVLL